MDMFRKRPTTVAVFALSVPRTFQRRVFNNSANLRLNRIRKRNFSLIVVSRCFCVCSCNLCSAYFVLVL